MTIRKPWSELNPRAELREWCHYKGANVVTGRMYNDVLGSDEERFTILRLKLDGTGVHEYKSHFYFVDRSGYYYLAYKAEELKS